MYGVLLLLLPLMVLDNTLFLLTILLNMSGSILYVLNHMFSQHLIQYKNVVEKFFHTKIASVYTDGGGEFIKLKQFFNQTRISQLLTPPYTSRLIMIFPLFGL